MTCLWTTSPVVSARRAQTSESWLGFVHSVADFLGRFELCLWTTSPVVRARRAQTSESWLGFVHSVAGFLGRFELPSSVLEQRREKLLVMWPISERNL